jgi:hypothetical protein
MIPTSSKLTLLLTSAQLECNQSLAQFAVMGARIHAPLARSAMA